MIKKIILLTFFAAFTIFSFSQGSQTTITLTDKVVTASSYTDAEIIINGQTDLHLTALTKPLINSVIKLNSEDSWVFFDNIRPDTVINSLLQYIKVNDQPAVLNTNIRIAIYKHGTAVIPHPSTYQPLEVFTGKDFTGSSQKYSLYTFYNNLGLFDNKIKSFKLKRGYMATLATKADGTGYSRVFIADKEDLLVSSMPEKLEGIVSFIRVFNWEWVTKKGWCQTGSAATPAANKVKSTWFYSWSADQSSSSTLEYVPIRQNGGWPGWSEINGKQRVTHLLGFNEPDHTEQSNLTVSQALAQWPDMIKTGLRIGSPACTGTGWLYQFMDSCKAHDYRVDFVAWHAYWGGKSPQNWYNDLKAIHDRTGRPIWITEWNNGANWTTESWPDDPSLLTPANAQKQLNDLTKILQVLDTASFIERYSIYNWVENARAIILADTLTPAGKYYANDTSDVSFKRVNEVIPTLSYSTPSLGIQFSGVSTVTLNSSDPNGEFNRGYRLDEKIDNNSFAKIQDTLGLTAVRYSEYVDLSTVTRVRYRLRTILPDGVESANSNEVGFDVTQGNDIQFGNIAFSNTDWNTIFFKQSYTTVPVIIFGSPTNNNSTVKMSNRVKQYNTNRFYFQFAPWAYQGVTKLSKDETIPYFVLKAGSYDFGGLAAKADKVAVNTAWTQITFSAPFDTIPVVFVTQLTSSTTFATGIRIRNVTKTGFEAKIQKESKITASVSPETVSYLAITPGKGIINNQEVTVGRTEHAPISTSGITNIQYGDTIANPIFIAQFQTCNDDTVTATLRCVSIFTNYARVIKQRETSLGITTAANEDAGWMIINSGNGTTGIKTVKHTEIKVFPNPAMDYLYFNHVLNDNVRVSFYNVYGALVKAGNISGNRIDVSDLPSGYYLIKTSDDKVGRFVKL